MPNKDRPGARRRAADAVERERWMLAIQVFGPVQVLREGEPAALPASRKTRALLGYLALSGSPQRRDRLCELFWEIPDDPRGALRWSLSKLRPIVNAPAQPRLHADRERVQLDTETIALDFNRVSAVCGDEAAGAEALAKAWETASHVLLEDCELTNQESYAAWLEQQRNEAVRLRIRLARRLALAPELAPDEAEKWAERWLLDAPFDPFAAQHAVFCRRRLGREADAAALTEELERAFQGAGLEVPIWSFNEPEGGDAPPAPERAAAPRQAIRFVQAEDEITLAWASVGDPARAPLVKAANWLSHLELDWEAPIWSPLFRQLASDFHFVRYDERGCGLSDWDVPEISLDAFVTDLEAVADAAGLARFPLLGISQGAAVSIEFAARHPERVSHLILFGGYAAGWRHTAKPEEVREREAIMVLTETGWGRADPSYRHLFSQSFMPGATAAELAWFDEFQRRTTSPGNAVRFLKAFADIDVRARLKHVQAPTLVVHSRGDLRIPVASGRALAAQIPGAEFAVLDSDNHLLLGREPASQAFIDLVKRFVAS